MEHIQRRFVLHYSDSVYKRKDQGKITAFARIYAH
jgi:hypothetical protein